MITTTFWFNEPSILYEKQYLFEIFPFKRFDMIRKLNAIMRLFIIYSIVMYIIKRDNRYLIVPIVIGGITYFIWTRQKDTKEHEIIKASVNDELSDLMKLNDLETECTVPTKENPFMNPSFFDYGNNKEKTKSCPSYNNIGMQRRIDEFFNEDLYRDVNDVFDKNNGKRQFYTVPGSNVPNDQGSFAQWLYGSPSTCKEGNNPIACLQKSGVGGSGGWS